MKLNLHFKLIFLHQNSNFELTQGYLNQVLNNPTRVLWHEIQKDLGTRSRHHGFPWVAILGKRSIFYVLFIKPSLSSLY